MCIIYICIIYIYMYYIYIYICITYIYVLHIYIGIYCICMNMYVYMLASPKSPQMDGIKLFFNHPQMIGLFLGLPHQLCSFCVFNPFVTSTCGKPKKSNIIIGLNPIHL